MVVTSILYFSEEVFASIAVIFFAAMVLSYLMPLVLHITELRLCDFCKGVLSLLFLAPTYINLISIYAISNIHDVTWGSRPSSKDTKAHSQRDKQMGIEFR